MVRSLSPPISSHSHSLMNKQIHETKLFRLSGSPAGSEHRALIPLVFAVLILPVVTFIDAVWSGWEAQLSQSDGDQLQTCGTEGRSDQPARNEGPTGTTAPLVQFCHTGPSSWFSQVLEFHLLKWYLIQGCHSDILTGLLLIEHWTVSPFFLQVLIFNRPSWTIEHT